MGAEDNLVRDFQNETNTYLEKQIKHEENEKESEMEL